MSGVPKNARWWFLGLLVLAVFALAPYAYGLISRAIASPCDEIFRQTRLILDSKLEPVKAKGSVALEEAAIRNLSERSEMMAMNLKSCCIGLHEERLTSAEFLGCKNSMQRFEEKIEKTGQVIAEAEAAQHGQDEDLLAAKRQEARSIVETMRGGYEDMVGRLRDASVQLAQKPEERTQPSVYDGVVVELTRFQDTGGMVTLEAHFRNVSTEPVAICLNPAKSYLLDEATATKWSPTFSEGFISCHSTKSLPPSSRHFFWMKFELPEPYPERFTAVVVKAVRPFEGIALE